MLVGLAAVLICVPGLRAEDALLTLGDFIIAIDTDLVSESSYPTGGNDERPAMILDGAADTKYLNFGEEYSGFIVIPTHGSSTVQSMMLTTANDAEERDPATYEIYGTNEPIVSANNSDGKGETWTLIASGSLALPVERLTAAPIAGFTNTTAYTAYKVLFPTVKNAAAANSMQVAEVALYETTDGTSPNILSEGGVVLAVDDNSASSYPVPSENPANILDGMPSSKYLNFGRDKSGFIVTPARGASAVQSMAICTANDVLDYAERNPTSYEIYGTNDPITSEDNSLGTAENWTLVAAGELALPLTNFTWGPVVSFTNATAYTSYKVLFPTVRDMNATGDAVTANSMQISEVTMYESTDGTGSNVLASGGIVLAIDPDSRSESFYAAAVAPPQAIDGSTLTQYTNTGGVNSGFIATPSVGLSIATSFKITTADTAPENDPAAWTLYGTVEPIVSADNSAGDLESWTAIASGTVDLPVERLTEGPVIPFTNTTAYTSYRMLFTNLRDASTAISMQMAEVQLFGTIVSQMPDQLLSPGDFIIAFDLDPDTSGSNYPANEDPPKAFDNNTGTKYLNFAMGNSGLIVTPTGGPSVVRSLVLTTANDWAQRDPASFALYGTNDAIVSINNSLGTAENWTLIAEGPLALPDARFTAGAPVTFDNATSYTSYKLLFPTIKDAPATNSMQIAEVALHTEPDGAGTNVLVAGSPVLAIDADVVPSSSYPAAESPANAIDRTTPAKYLNFGENNSGFIVQPSVGSTVVTSFKFITANDAPERDPAGWALYGTNDTIVSADNGHGDLESWTPIASGTMSLPAARQSAGSIVEFENTADYTAYRMVFTSVKDAAVANSMQFGEVQFYGTIGVACNKPFADGDGDGDVDQIDFATFQLCFTGAGGAATSHECRCLDRDKDTDVDTLDFAAFVYCVTGPAIPWTQESRPNCVP